MKVAVQLILTFLLNAFWQIALVAGFALVCDWLLRGTAARYRHGVWVAALLLCLTLPALSLSRVVKTLTLVTQPPVKLAGGPEGFVSTYSPELDSPQANLATAQVSAPPVPAPAGSPGWGLWIAPIRFNSRLAFALSAIYGLFLLYRAGQLFRAWRRTRKIIQTAKAFELTAGIEAMIKGCKTAIGVTRVRILGSPAVPVPITVGIRNPLIILPERLLQDVDEEVLTTAIGHELVHVARRDYLLNLIYEFIYLPLSFHPAAALLRRRIRQTRELCCDEAVATKLLRAETYARSLVRLVGSASLGRRRAADTAIGITESDILEVRIMSLLKTRTLSARSRRLSLVAATLILTLPCIAATAFALSFDIERQEPGPAALEQSLKHERQAQVREREELKRAVRQLEEQVRVAPESKRAEIQARLREVQENLKQHEMAVQQFYQEKQESLKKAQDLREILAQAERNQVGQAQRKLLEQELASIEAQNSAETARVREVQQKLVESYQSSLERKARAIYRVEPEYSEDARAKKIEGTVVLGLTIDHSGVPQNIQVKRSLYSSLDQKAVEAVSKWRFEPALKNGEPASMWVTVEVYFALDSRTKEDLEKIAAQQREEQTWYAVLRRRKQEEVRTQEERSRKQVELTRGATLSMDRAIQIATSQVPGKVLACSLGRDGDKIFYHVVIIGGDGDKTTATYVWVSATDGQILKTEKEKEERKESFPSSRNDDLSESGPNAPIQGGVLNGKATTLPAPEFPAIARQAHASGAVTVKVVIDEGGNVVAARAVSGHPLLQSAAVTAARQARFTPTRMSGEPVRVSGTLVYNFVSQ